MDKGLAGLSSKQVNKMVKQGSLLSDKKIARAEQTMAKLQSKFNLKDK